MPGILYIVATPIGNLEDISVRALQTIGTADLLLAEDTRQTQKIVSHFGFKAEIVRFDTHAAASDVQNAIKLLGEGKNLALVTDAGTPAISDPGAWLVAEVVRAFGDEAKIIPIPGPSAVTAALSVSGFNSDEFVFYGFVPPKKGRDAKLKEIAGESRTAVVFESPHRIEKTLAELSALCPERRAVVCRELTKMFETVYRGKLSELAALGKIRVQGEFVIVLAPQK
jgi:16S rRNA (cytidine1402-2'-O)-methyltransferase